MLERLARQGVGLDSLELFEELVSAEQMYWRARRARGWHHIAGLYDGANLRLAVDGVLDDQVIATGFKDSNIGLQIGARTANNFFFDGSISGVRVSSNARYADDFIPPLAYEVDADTLGLYRLEEGKGLITVDGSGKDNTGDLMGGAAWAMICPP